MRIQRCSLGNELHAYQLEPRAVSLHRACLFRRCVLPDDVHVTFLNAPLDPTRPTSHPRLWFFWSYLTCFWFHWHHRSRSEPETRRRSRTATTKRTSTVPPYERIPDQCMLNTLNHYIVDASASADFSLTSPLCVVGECTTPPRFPPASFDHKRQQAKKTSILDKKRLSAVQTVQCPFP